MSLSVLKLESFTPVGSMSRVAAAAARAALDEAYQRGVVDGRSAQHNSETAALTAALQEMAQQIAADETRRTELRREAVAALAPILSAMLDAIVPIGTARRLEQDLVGELTRLARQTPPVVCQVACSSEMRPMVERCAADAGMTAIDIIEQPLGQSLHLNLSGGHIEFSQDQVVQSVRRLIAEIQED
ncbi:MAG: hypothetical protein Q4G22_09325 [Paracoccus sp. (in: a-proteobacteria)]|uniref:hypothetical protein n=1 Tax=Paracoccus sp. TaxID=267 RepID=UPI0026DEF2CA|nr:hypothetical protein [Paracoccus sp. (in: a-proteobacteria)]MDO5632027.1 hypothetical protein [Paracoccus sp. (in: a-proteobacteria)]